MYARTHSHGPTYNTLVRLYIHNLLLDINLIQPPHHQVRERPRRAKSHSRRLHSAAAVTHTHTNTQSASLSRCQTRIKQWARIGIWREGLKPPSAMQWYRTRAAREWWTCRVRRTKERYDLQRMRSASLWAVFIHTTARQRHIMRADSCNMKNHPLRERQNARSLALCIRAGRFVNAGRIAATTCRHARSVRSDREPSRALHLSTRAKRCRENSLSAAHMQSVRAALLKTTSRAIQLVCVCVAVCLNCVDLCQRVNYT